MEKEPLEEKEDKPDAEEVVKNEKMEKSKQYYTIQPGDTMVSICMEQFQSLERMDDILKLNQIEDKDKIVAGQKIKLWE